jgi:uncharacterized membrane protein
MDSRLTPSNALGHVGQKVVLLHAVLSFVYNTVILAVDLAVNLMS